MTYDEFVEKYQTKSQQWKFDKFLIQCRSCGSSKVEFNGNIDAETGYYYSCDLEGRIIVKYHTCGNAMILETYDLN